MLLNWLRRWQKHQELTVRGRAERRRQKRRGSGRLRLERLEDRTLLAVNPFSWTELGPGPIQNVSGVGGGAEVGAVESIRSVLNSDGSYTLYAGTMNGGAWRADNVTPDGVYANPSSINWQPLTDQPNVSSLAVSSLAVDPNDSNTLWVGTGSLSSDGNDGGAPIGLLKTTNANALTPTWQTLGQKDLSGQRIVSVVPTTVVDPGTGQIVLVAAHDGKGIMRSIDGGQTFQPVNIVDRYGQYLTDSNGKPLLLTGEATDLIADPANDKRFYAAVVGFGGGSNSDVFVSNNDGAAWVKMSGDGAIIQITGADNLKLAAQTVGINTTLFVATGGDQQVVLNGSPTGGTFTLTYNNQTTGAIAYNATAAAVQSALQSLPAIGSGNVLVAGPPGGPWEVSFSGSLGRTGLQGNAAGLTGGTSPAVNINTGMLSGAFDGTDVGDVPTWNEIGLAPSGQQEDAYFGHFAALADPTTPNVFYIAGYVQDFYRVNASNGSWTSLDNSYQVYNSGPHDDQLCLWFLIPGTLLVGDDGGIYGLNNPNASGTSGVWFSFNANLRDTEFLKVALDPANTGVAFGAAWDNGTSRYNSSNGTAWQDTGLNGDSVGVAVSPVSSQRVYAEASPASAYPGYFVLSPNGGNGNFANVSPPEAQAGSGAFLVAPNQPGNGNDRVLYAGSVLWESTNDGNSGTWQPIAGNPGDNWPSNKNFYIAAFDISANHPNTIYAVGNIIKPNTFYTLFYTTNDGGSWTQTSAPAQVRINDIKVDPNDDSTAYVITQDGKVYQTKNYGAAWKDISGVGLPGTPLRTMAVDFSRSSPVLYVGSNDGVYASNNLGANWFKFGAGLPNVAVTDLELDTDPQHNILAAGTLGRGLWEIQPEVTAQIQNRVLVVNSNNDNVTIHTSPSPNDNSLVDVWEGGTGGTVDNLVGTFSKNDFGRIQVNGGGGDDTLTIDYSYGLPASTVGFDGGGGTNILYVVDRSGESWAQETDTMSSYRGGEIRFYAAGNPVGPVIDYNNVDSIDDTLRVTNYQMVDSLSGSGQELGVEDASSPIGPYVTTITGNQTTADDLGGAFFISFAERYVDNKSNVTVEGPTTPTIFGTTLSTPGLPLTLQGQSGQDTFNINYAPNQNTITVTGTGTDQLNTLNINDTTNTDNQGGTYDIRSNQIERTGSGFSRFKDQFFPYSEDVTLAYSNIGSLFINGGDNGYVYNVHNTAPGTYTTIVPGGGQDQVNLIPDPQAFDSVIGSLRISGNTKGTGSAALSLDDTELVSFIAGDPTGYHFVFTPQSIAYTESAGELQRTATFQEQFLDGTVLLYAFPSSSTVDVQYDSVSSVTVKDSSNTKNLNTFKVVGTEGVAQTELELQQSNDTVQIGDNGDNSIGQIGGVHSLEFINNVDVQGTAGSVVTVDDEADHALFPNSQYLYTHDRMSSTGYPTYTISDGSLVFESKGTDNIIDDLGGVHPTPFDITSTITYSGIGSLIVQGSSYLSTGNIFNVQNTQEPATIKAGSRGDTINTGDPQVGLDGIGGTLTAVGTGNTLLVLDDPAERNSINYLDSRPVEQTTNHVGWVVTNGLVMHNNQIVDASLDSPESSSSLFTSNFVYSGLSELTLNGGHSGNHFYVQSTAAGTPVTINTGSPIAGDPVNTGVNTVDTGSDVLPSLVSYYAGEDNANDGFGANDGAVQGNVTYGPGHVGQGFQFDGVNGSVNIPADPSLDVGSGGGLTLAAWINPADLSTARPILEWTNGLRLWESVTYGGAVGPGNLYANLQDTNGNAHIISSAPGVLQTGKWQLVALTYDNASGIATLYLNGQVVAQQNFGSFNPVTNTDLTLGHRLPTSFDGNPTPFSGGMDDVGIYNRALTAAEMQTLFTGPNLDPIASTVNVNGQGGSDTLNIHDESTSSGQAYGVSATHFTRTPDNPPSPLGSPTQTINYSSLEQVNVHGGSGADFWSMLSTAPRTTTALYSGSGIVHNPDEIIVENAINLLDDMHGPLAIHGTPYDFVEAVDEGNTIGHNYTLTTGLLTRDNGASPISISYDGIGEFVVATANNPYSGHSPNTVNVESLGKVSAIIVVGTGDTVTLGQLVTGQNDTLAGILGEVRIQDSLGQVPKQIILNDLADMTSHTVRLGSDPFFGYLVSGLANNSQGEGLIGLDVDPTTPVSIYTGVGANLFSVHDLTNAPALSVVGDAAGTNTLQGPNTANTWKITGVNAGSLDGTVSFFGIQNLLGGTDNNMFQFQTGGSLSGTLNGGGGTNTLDYSAHSGPIVVDLLLGMVTGVDGGAANGESNIQNVTGSQGNDLIVGDANANVLIGGTGRNVIISGGGADAVTGGGSDNLLIAGTTAYDTDPALTALDAILAEWTSSDSLGTRTHDILTGGGKNGNYYLNPNASKTLPATVFSNPSAKLFDGPGTVLSWFFVASRQQINNGGTFHSSDRLEIIH